jgi:hypothetical protein
LVMRVPRPPPPTGPESIPDWGRRRCRPPRRRRRCPPTSWCRAAPTPRRRTTRHDLCEITPSEPVGVFLDHCLLLYHTITSDGSTIAERRTHRWAKPLSSSGVTSVWRYVKTAPLTYSWLVLLLTTTIIQHSIPAHRLQALLQKESTNLHHLASDPIRVLFQSLLWIDGKYWWPYLLVFTLFWRPPSAGWGGCDGCSRGSRVTSEQRI